MDSLRGHFNRTGDRELCPLMCWTSEPGTDAIMTDIPSMISSIPAAWSTGRAWTNAEIFSGLQSAAGPEPPSKVLVSDWGRAGAGAKFTYELTTELQNLRPIEPTVSASAGSGLAGRAGSDKSIAVRTVRTFQGDRTTWAGRPRGDQ
jgi:hypothetical protein